MKEEIGPDELISRGKLARIWKIRNETVKQWLADRAVPVADIPGQIDRYRYADILAAAGIGNPDAASVDAVRERTLKKADDDHRSKLVSRSLKF